MKTVHIDARKVMNASSPIREMASLFDIETGSPEELTARLTVIRDPMIAEVANWPVRDKLWEELADLLEGVQQHSNTFYLIWGTRDDMVNPDASSPSEELVNPAWALPSDSKGQTA